jgi:hypothetical protein
MEDGSVELNQKRIQTENEIMNNTRYIKIDSDDWQDVGKIYKVVEYFRRNNESTAVELKLELQDGQVVDRVVPYHWIEWIEDGDW